MNPPAEKDRRTPSQAWESFESPFLEGESFGGETQSDWEAQLSTLEAETPFAQDLFSGTSLSVEPEFEGDFSLEYDLHYATEEMEAFSEELEFEDLEWGETEEEAEAYEDEVTSSLALGAEELYEDESLDTVAEADEDELISEEAWSEYEEDEVAYPTQETTYALDESFLSEESFIESEELESLFSQETILERVKRLVGEGIFNLSLLSSFTSGQIWNEDYLALEILFSRRPTLRPSDLNTLSGLKRLRKLRSLAVRYRSELTPIREGFVRPIFGNPANFQIGSETGCQIRDLREEVRKLGPLPGGKNKQGKTWYKRDPRYSPRKLEAVNSIVLHHMAYNIGNDVTLYRKVGAHYIVTADGQIAQLYNDLDFLNAANGFNPRAISIEFAGNFPDLNYHWWKSKELTIPDRCYLTPTQIRAGRCLLATLKARLPGIQYVYAHRQSSSSRENDPGPDVWLYIGEWAIQNLNLTDEKPRTHVGDGQPILPSWRVSRPLMPVSSTLPSPEPASPAAPSPKPASRQLKPPAELVRFAQRVLNATEGERLDDDGDLGPLTRGALERFRKKYQLGSGGVLDAKTELALAQRALEEIRQQSLFGQFGVLDAATRNALVDFKTARGLGSDSSLDPATRLALTSALVALASAPGTSRPSANSDASLNLGASLTPPTDPNAYRKFRLTTYHVVDQGDAPTGAVRVPIFDENGRKIAEGSPTFFAKLSLEGTARLSDRRLINVTGKTVPVNHTDYADVLAYHNQAYAKRNKKRREQGRGPVSTKYSGIVVQNGRVVRALAFHEVPRSKLGAGYGIHRGIPLTPFRTLAADIGHTKYASVEPKWRGKGGLVPPGTRVYIKEYAGLKLPDGTLHDGWFIVNDTGGAIFGAHFDVFVGTLALRRQVQLPEFGQVWFQGIEQRIPKGYAYGLKP